MDLRNLANSVRVIGRVFRSFKSRIQTRKE